jgi:hypothetical protein
MAEEPESVADETGRKGFVKRLSRTAATKTLEPLASAAATAGTAYLMRKTTQIWRESVQPKIRDKGGPKGVAKEALEKVAPRLGGQASDLLLGLASRLDQSPTAQTHTREPNRVAERQVDAQDRKREEKRRERQRRRQQRERALKESGST